MIRNLCAGMVAIFLVICTLYIGVATAKSGLQNSTFQYSDELRDYWNRTYGNFIEAGNDFANRITVDGNGYAYITGSTNETGSGTEIVVMKFDLTSRTIVWAKTWGTSGMDAGNGITLDSNGNIYVVGTVYYASASSADAVILKYDNNGNLLKTTYYDNGYNDRGKGIVYDHYSNSIYITGISRGGVLDGLEVFVAKYDLNLNMIWDNTYDYTSGARPDGGLDIDVDSSGNIYITGGAYTGASSLEDILILKYDSSGNLLWDVVKDIGGDNDFGWRLTVLNTIVGWRIIVLGYSFSIAENEYKMVVVCYDTSGNYKWYVSFSSNGEVQFDFSKEMFVNGGITSDGEYIYVVGESKIRGSTGNDTYFLKYDLNGNLITEKYLYRNGRDFGRDIILDGDVVYIVGSLQSSTNDYDGYILSTDKTGGDTIYEINTIIFAPLLAIIIYLVFRDLLSKIA